MSEQVPPEADAPRKKADVWAYEKATAAWQLAAARLVCRWSASDLFSEHDFDAAIARVRDAAFG